MFQQNLSVDTDHSPHKLSSNLEHTVLHHTANMGRSLSFFSFFFSFSHSLTFKKTHHQTVVQHQGSVELGNQGKWNSSSFKRTKICSIENCKKERLFSSEREIEMQKRGGVWKKERAVQLDSSGLPLTILRRVSSSSCFLASVYIVSRPERDVWYTSRSALISCCAACNIKADLQSGRRG